MDRSSIVGDKNATAKEDKFIMIQYIRIVVAICSFASVYVIY